MPFTVSRLQSHTFISKTKDEKSLSDKDQPFGNIKYLGIRYVMPGFLELQPHTRTESLCNCLANNG